MSSFATSTTTTTATTRHETDAAYMMDNIFPTVAPSCLPLQQKYDDNKDMIVAGSSVLTSSPTTSIAMSQSNSMTYDCLPQLQRPSISVLSLENLSNQHAIGNEWISPLVLGYSEYNEQDMNFLLAYNELVASSSGNKLTTTTNMDSQPSISAASSTLSEDTRNGSSFEFQQGKGGTGTEQYHRFSMMDVGTSNKVSSSSSLYNYTYMEPPQLQQQQRVVVSSPTYLNFNHKNHLCRQQATVRTHKERCSMQEQASPSLLTWQQSNLLQKRPVTDIKQETEEEYQDKSLNKYNSMVQSRYPIPPPSATKNNLTNGLYSSISSPLKKRAQKRSMADYVEYNTVPSTVSSISEPIPTAANWIHPSRKRTKSIRTSNKSRPAEISPVVENDFDDESSRHMIDYPEYVLSNDLLANNPSSDLHQHLSASPRRQKLRYEGDDYTPKLVRYTGHLKEGYCDSCIPGKWLQLKNSAYWYHKQFYHGISSVSGKPFMKPLEQRMGKRDMIEGLCHQCHRYVPACNGKKKINYMLWYRHAHKCHLYDKPKAASKTMRKSSITCSNGSVSSTSNKNVVTSTSPHKNI